MNLFNRIVVVVLCLALAAAAVSVIAFAWTIPDDSIERLRDAVNWLSDHNEDLEKALLTTGGALIGLIALIVALLELTPQSGTEVKVTDLQVGDAVLSTAAIGQRVEEAVRQVANVAEVRAVVKAKRKGVQVALDLHVDPEANLALVTDEACQAARDVLTNRVHVALAEAPRARLHYRELRLRRASTRPAAPALEPTLAPPREDETGPGAETSAAEPQPAVAGGFASEEHPPEERKPAE